MNPTISKLKSSLSKIGKSDYGHNTKIKDFLYDGHEVSSYSEDYFVNANNDFNGCFNQLLNKNKVDKKLIQFLFENTAKFHNELNEKKNKVRASYLYLSGKEELREGHERTHEIINSMINAQKSTLKVIHEMLNDLYNNLDYLTEDDIATFKVKAGIEEDKSQLIKLPNVGKVNLNLSKKDAISLFLILEHLDVLDFNKADRKDFIEKNFTFKKEKNFVNIGSEISNLYDTKTLKSRNKSSVDKLRENIIGKLSTFDFNRFLNSRKI